MAIFFNEQQKLIGTKTYIPITKDAFSLPAFREVKSKYTKLDISYLISLGALLHFPIKPQRNSYFSSNTSSSNTHTNWKKAQEIYFEKSDFLTILYELLSLKIKYKEESMSHTSFCNEFINEIKKSIKKYNLSELQTQKLENWANMMNLLKGMISYVDDDAQIEEQIQQQYYLLEDEIIKISTLKKDRIMFVGNFIYAYLTIYPKDTLKRVLSTDLRFNFNFYGLIYLMSLLREKYNDIDTLIQNFPTASSFEPFFKKIDEYIQLEIIDIFGEFNENGEKVIKESLSIGGAEKETDHEILKKLYEFNK